MAYNGTVYYLAGRYNESIEAFNKSLELDPKDAAAQLLKVLPLRALHRNPEANAVLSMVIGGLIANLQS